MRENHVRDEDSSALPGGWHRARATASAVHTDALGGYTPTEHARALDRLLADIEALPEDAGVREPKLTLARSAEDRSFFEPETEEAETWLITRTA